MLCLGILLGPDTQQVVFERDIDIILGDTRQICGYNDGLFGLADIDPKSRASPRIDPARQLVCGAANACSMRSISSCIDRNVPKVGSRSMRSAMLGSLVSDIIVLLSRTGSMSIQGGHLRALT
jgi:hypothetical protein